jgi:hypothetical protein
MSVQLRSKNASPPSSAAEFSKPITAVLASGKPETKDDLLVREQMDRAETFELQQAFDDYCWSFKRKWSG